MGTIEALQDGELTVRTGFAGVLTIDAAKLQGLSSASPLAIDLDSGERIIGKLQYHPDSGQSVLETAFGEVALEVARIASLSPPGEPRPTAQVAQAEEKVEALQADLDQVRPNWTGLVEAGFNGSSGNTDRVFLNGRSRLQRKTETERLIINLQGRFAEENEERTTNELLGGIKLENDVSPRLFVFGDVFLEFDEFEDLDLRARPTAGIGYFLLREQDLSFKLRGGGGFQHESFDDGSSQNEGLAEAGWDLENGVSDWLLITHSLTYFPTFADFSDFRLVGEAAGEIPIASDQAWKIKLGIRSEFNNQPLPGIEQLDNYFFINFLREFN